jgi:hypothetical protein
MNSAQPPPHQGELLDYELRVQRYGLQKLWAWLRTPRGLWTTAALVILLTLVWQTPAIYRAVRIKRVKALIAESEAAHRLGDPASETRLLAEATRLLPGHAITWRARAHHCEREGDSTALVMYHALLVSNGATLDDAVRACRLTGLRGAPNTCAQMLVLAERIKGASEHPALLSLRARTLAIRGAWSDAIALAQRAAGSAEAGASERLMLAMLLLGSADQGEKAERLPTAKRAVAMLDTLATGADATALDALTALVGLAQHPMVAELVAEHNVLAWLAAVESHPAASASLRVRAWNLRLATERDAPEKVFSAFLEKWRNSEPPECLEAARWLSLHGRPLLSLELSEPRKDLSEEWFLVHLEALGATQQWAEALARLDAAAGPAATLASPLRAAFRLTASAKLGLPVQPDETWREIQIQLQSEPVRIRLFIAHYAEASGENKQAAAIYRGILTDFTTGASLELGMSRESRLACYKGLLRNLPATAPAAEVAPFAQALAEDFPEIESARSEALYLRALAGGADSTLDADIAQWRQQSPSAPLQVATSALVTFSSGDAAAAAGFFDDVKIDWSATPDRIKAVRFAVLATIGRTEEAQTMRNNIREGNLRPEELELLR